MLSLILEINKIKYLKKIKKCRRTSVGQGRPPVVQFTHFRGSQGRACWLVSVVFCFWMFSQRWKLSLVLKNLWAMLNKITDVNYGKTIWKEQSLHVLDPTREEYRQENDPWTTWVCPARVHFYVDFFFNKYSKSFPSADSTDCSWEMVFSVRGWESAVEGVKILCPVLSWSNLRMRNPRIQSTDYRGESYTWILDRAGSAPLTPVLVEGRLY